MIGKQSEYIGETWRKANKLRSSYSHIIGKQFIFNNFSLKNPDRVLHMWPSPVTFKSEQVS